ncbi:DUF7224 domain-containing protein [Streptomyces sp. NBC_00286]|uniref:DUF7224 domain-containing protein n=1 Tax=Streptomyces sp. NBC_00286 TaxID=2975701 RepID=UPI002E2B12D7|nr:hypothetical protein [Streptomyces sp. NBC_00286]
MTITWANLRASAAPWLLLPALIYISLYIGDVTYTAPSHYGVESGEIAAFPMAVIAPAAAGATAWEAGRHRLLGAMRATSPRNPVVQLLRAVTPALILYVVLAVAALVFARNATGVWPGDAGWLAAAHLIVLPLGWTIIGWCAGRTLPGSIAAPLVAIGCWAWLAMPHSFTNPSLRHLGGFIDGGSTVTDIRDPAVYLVPWGVVAGLAVAAWLLTSPHRRGLKATIGAVTAAATLVTGYLAVTDWGYAAPTHPRTVAMSCTGQAPRVCVPPEYQPYAEQLRRDAMGPIDDLKAAGIPAPQELRITSASTPLKPGTWPLYWSLPALHEQASQERYEADLAESAVAGVAATAGVRDCQQPGSPAAAWAALVIGLDTQSIQQAMLPAEWTALQKVRQMPAADQADWFKQKVASQEHCNRVGT